MSKATKIEITLPPEIAHYEAEFRYFVDSMVRKLHANRHKGFVDGLDFVRCLDGIQAEIVELEMSKSQFEAFMEAVDIANWGFLTAVFLGRMTRPEFDAIDGDREKGTQYYDPISVRVTGSGQPKDKTVYSVFRLQNGKELTVPHYLMPKIQDMIDELEGREAKF